MFLQNRRITYWQLTNKCFCFKLNEFRFRKDRRRKSEVRRRKTEENGKWYPLILEKRDISVTSFSRLPTSDYVILPTKLTVEQNKQKQQIY